ncbi:MAG: ATP phosphoribosyltransferase regulatory subunit [Peptostreptococcales bacterium]
MVNKRKFTPEGVEDINSAKYEKKELIQTKIKEIFRTFGYTQVLTPTFEYYDLFSEMDSSMNLDDMYKLIDKNGKILVLRPDVTIPIARMVATSYNTINDDIKLSYNTSVYRSADFRAGERREFIQAGIEYIGNNSAEADAEVIATAIKAMQSLNFDSIHIDMGETDYFKGIMQSLDIEDEAKYTIKQLIEKKNLGDLKNLLKTISIEDDYKELLLEIPLLYGEMHEVLDKIKHSILTESMKKAIDNMCSIYKILDDYGYGDFIFIDLGLVNHLEYYSGMIFKGYIGNHGLPVLSGGRYDELLGKFGREISARGFGINIDEILSAMKDTQLLDFTMNKKDYLILYHERNRKLGFKESDGLRSKGFIVEAKKLKDDDKVLGEELAIKYKFDNYKKVLLVSDDNVDRIKD